MGERRGKRAIASYLKHSLPRTKLTVESGSNIISADMDGEEIALLLAKNKAYVLEARNYIHGQPFLVGEYFDECSSNCHE